MNTGSKRKGVQCKLMTQLRAVGEPTILRKNPAPSYRRLSRRLPTRRSRPLPRGGDRPARRSFPSQRLSLHAWRHHFTEEMNMKSMVSPKEMTAKIRDTCRLSQGEEAIAGEEPAGALPSHPGRRAAPGRVRRPFR
jgi:hypothetical protein